MKIFIIEAEKIICKELTVLLKKYGFTCEGSDDFVDIADGDMHLYCSNADCFMVRRQEKLLFCRQYPCFKTTINDNFHPMGKMIFTSKPPNRL